VHEGERWPRPNDLHLLTCYDRASSLYINYVGFLPLHV